MAVLLPMPIQGTAAKSYLRERDSTAVLWVNVTKYSIADVFWCLKKEKVQDKVVVFLNRISYKTRH